MWIPVSHLLIPQWCLTGVTLGTLTIDINGGTWTYQVDNSTPEMTSRPCWKMTSITEDFHHHFASMEVNSRVVSIKIFGTNDVPETVVR